MHAGGGRYVPLAGVQEGVHLEDAADALLEGLLRELAALLFSTYLAGKAASEIATRVSSAILLG